ncbi:MULTISPECIES: DUF4153 domain-containing protein [Chryseobacterium]|uniref:MFS family permease n=1 Tax=Chryseobacterium camelliae TaxID=1265445 RepID=A0ABU0TP48_9FLAO|nr:MULTISPECIES: DUF4173 domain-containing protein [Chryseobacterium]MDT3407385.1 MFS family permease [Pseudacidovorax intermedius]MDQ1098766.1 MFS family permease [Chryseobacterium camelliae]MDQ1102690.1 MFS family permease [Chryseobacterium sp. SORGH_AS_1048]MDR6086119.1 MFS family permease [Chryseobacterium sp. SORGH_AS_0909]MDR6130489.1 MFS family permease [Chryseobacterium sp. SORGH_AS_1175]
MKTHHYIFLTTALFVVLFYNENVGLNLGILCIIYSVLTLLRTPAKNKTKTFFVLIATSVISGIAFAWYGDLASFLAVVSSLLLLSYRSKNRRMKILLLIPVFVINTFTSVCRFFSFDEWLPEKTIPGFWQKMFAFVLIPLVLVSIFFGIYAAGSHHFAELYSGYEWDLDIWQFLCMAILGFFIAFNYWNYAVEKLIYKQNMRLNNDFKSEEKTLKNTYSFFDLEAERMSGVISFLLLNILLIFFIVTYNYEQFYEGSKAAVKLSEETHERVNAVILSIVMAVLVMMFYFKSAFNFDPKAGILKILAKIWIALNATLILSAMAKNAEYIMEYGYTYKRLGVSAFLILSMIGLVLMFIKIQRKKKNIFLFNTMAWFAYATILVCSFINWGGFITLQNVQRKNFNPDFHRVSVHFNEKILLEYADRNNKKTLKNEILEQVKKHKDESLLSRALYYDSIR